ncbi:MAG: F0F1 ATP synthase subunit gamma [Anaerolineales bacterium]
MTQNVERANSRLGNIQSIEPLLSSLRTISMGTWQIALNKITKVNQCEAFYDEILDQILPQLKHPSRLVNKPNKSSQPEIAEAIILLIGSERGLCGKFNENLLNKTIQWINTQNFSSYEIWTMGSRMIKELEQRDINFSWRTQLSSSEVPSFHSAYRLCQNWLTQYETHAFSHFWVIFNKIANGNRYAFSTFELLPHQIRNSSKFKAGNESKWPPAIIETNPKGIFQKIIQYKIATNFFRTLLESAAAEHASRFTLMQDAKKNAEEIIEELELLINAERKRKITQEIQELASAAGLLDN